MLGSIVIGVGEQLGQLRRELKQRRWLFVVAAKRPVHRGRLAGKRHISERPHEVETRTTTGHWEIDTVAGAQTKDCVVTLVERRTGFTLIGKLPDRTMGSLSRRVQVLARRVPRDLRTVTSDNGTEFHDYKSIEAATGVTFYFATPYHSWERGTHENLNGLLRQYLPKRTSQAGITQRHVRTYPRALSLSSGRLQSVASVTFRRSFPIPRPVAHAPSD